MALSGQCADDRDCNRGPRSIILWSGPCATPGADGAPRRPYPGSPPMPPRRVINKQQAERDGEQIEEAIVASQRNQDLEQNEQSACGLSQAPWRPNEKRHHAFDEEQKVGGEIFEPFGCLLRPPTEDRLGAVASSSDNRARSRSTRNHRRPGHAFHYSRHHHQLEEEQLQEEMTHARERNITASG